MIQSMGSNELVAAAAGGLEPRRGWDVQVRTAGEPGLLGKLRGWLHRDRADASAPSHQAAAAEPVIRRIPRPMQGFRVTQFMDLAPDADDEASTPWLADIPELEETASSHWSDTPTGWADTQPFMREAEGAGAEEELFPWVNARTQR